MKRNSFEQFIAGMKQPTLSQTERAQMRHVLKALIETTVRTPARGRLAFVLTLAKTMPIFLLIALLAGGGVSVAAEGSLPGDTLYPVKVKLNEPVRGWVAVSSEAQAGWEAKRIERRLEEATELAAKGELSAEVAAQVEMNFEHHVERVAQRIEVLDAEENFQAAAEVTSNFETSLKAREKILTGIAEKREMAVAELKAAVATKSESREELLKLISAIQVRSKAASKARTDVEARLSVRTKTDVQAAAQGKLKAVEAKIEEAKKHIAKIREMLGAEATLQAQARLAVAEKTVAEGKVKLSAEAYGEAFKLFQSGHRIAQEAVLLIDARQRFDINIRLNGSAEVESSSSPAPSPESAEKPGIRSEGRIEIEL